MKLKLILRTKMLRFLKWIFFVFGGLGVVIMSFFYVQNKTDLHLYFGNRSTFNYENIKENCNTDSHYYFPCFIKEFDTYVQKVSLTGISLGLKTAFTFIDSDKELNKKFSTEENKVRFGLNHLIINNKALENSTKRFHGLEFTYGGYIGKVKDFLVRGMSFSDGIIKGLRGSDGISSLKNKDLEASYTDELSIIEARYQEIQNHVNGWLDREIKQLKDKHEVD
jgi:hypothetical protein